MKKIVPYIVAGLLAAMALAGCGGKKTIPDDTLSDIFRDIYIVNAYSEKQGARLDYDSINIYEPIMNSYGYTSEDFVYTIGNFSRRKSSRVSFIVDQAIEKLDNISAELAFQVNILDKVDSAAFERTKKVVYADSLIEIRSRADVDSMEIVIAPVHEGRYEVTYYTRIDSLDKNTGLNNRIFFRDSRKTQLGTTYDHMRNHERKLYTTTLEKRPRAEELVIRFGNYPVDAKTPIRLDIDSLTVVHYLPREEALRELLRTYIDYTLIIEGRPFYEYYDLPADSGTLHILPPLAPEEPDSVAVE